MSEQSGLGRFENWKLREVISLMVGLRSWTDIGCSKGFGLMGESTLQEIFFDWQVLADVVSESRLMDIPRSVRRPESDRVLFC